MQWLVNYMEVYAKFLQHIKNNLQVKQKRNESEVVILGPTRHCGGIKRINIIIPHHIAAVILLTWFLQLRW